LNLAGAGSFNLQLTDTLTVNSITVGGGGGSPVLTITAAGWLNVTSAISVASGGTLTVAGALTAHAATTIAGTLNVQSDASADFVGAVTINSGGKVTAASAALVNFAAGVTANAGADLTIGGAASLHGSSMVSGNLVVQSAGTLVVEASSMLQLDADATIDGALTLSGSSEFVVHSGTTRAAHNIVANGATKVHSVLVAPLYTQTKGALTLNGGTVVANAVNINANTTLTGSGSINGTLNNNGHINVGNSPGAVFVNGDYRMSWDSTFEMEVQDANSYDKLIITGTCYRDGILYAHFLNGYLPASGTSFNVFTHSDAQGDFNIVHGNYFEASFTKVSAQYATTTTKITYNAAATLVVSVVPLLLCVLALLL